MQDYNGSADQAEAKVLKRDRLSDGFLKLDRYTVSHRKFNGDWQTVHHEVHDHGNAVAVLPFDPVRQKVLLVRQFRTPVFLQSGDGNLIEVCAGIIESDDANAELSAEREAMEEMGVRVRNLINVGNCYSCPGVLTERTFLYLAEYSADDFIGQGGGLASESEDIELLEWDLDQLADAYQNNRIHDMKTLVLIQKLFAGPAKNCMQ